MRCLHPTERARQLLIHFFEFMHNPLLLLPNPHIKSWVNNPKKAAKPSPQGICTEFVDVKFRSAVLAGLYNAEMTTHLRQPICA